jgi:hypothetical protein
VVLLLLLHYDGYLLFFPVTPFEFGVDDSYVPCTSDFECGFRVGVCDVNVLFYSSVGVGSRIYPPTSGDFRTKEDGG